jgi:flagellar protein FlgJ
MQIPELLSARSEAFGSSAPVWPARQDGAFAQVFRQAHAEIAEVVQNGWPASTVPNLNADGVMHRAAALQAAKAAPLTASVSAPEQTEFLTGIAPWARQAGAALGVDAELVAAHAALESGWGQRPLRAADGSDSHNLFGIKAQGAWTGARVEVLTTEFEDGTQLKKTEGFRAYPDHASAFNDYARLLRSNPRYRSALNVGGDAAAFAQGLARGGYATDPAYADKLTRLATQLQTRK